MNEAVKTDQATGADKAKAWLAFALATAGVGSFYVLKGQQDDWVRWSTFVGGLLLAVIVFFLSQYGRDLRKFVLDARIELYKVFWPTRQETGTMTMVVFVFVIVLALFFWGVDSILSSITRALLGSGTDLGG